MEDKLCGYPPLQMLRLQAAGPIPADTMRVAQAAIPEGNTYLKLRNALGMRDIA
jgi:hypothetical protein